MIPGAPTRMATWLESAWLARYLERQLDGGELAWFEAYLLDKPELLGMLEADNSMRDALANQPRFEDENATKRRVVPEIQTSSAFRVRGRRLLSIAAALVLGIGTGWLGQRAMAPNTRDQVIVSPTRIVFDTIRGVDNGPSIDRMDPRSPYALFEIAVPQGAQEIMLDMRGAPLRTLSMSVDGFVSFVCPERAAQEGLVLRYKFEGREISRVLQLAGKYAAEEK